MKKVTIRDVAKNANVGVGTVSRVLNHNPSVRPETRQRVLAVIEKLDFTPNPIAQQLSSGKTNTIGVTLPFLTYPSFVERLRGVQKALEDTNYELILYSTDSPKRRDSHFRMAARKSRTDGLLIISIPIHDEYAELFLKSRTPVVLVDVLHPELNQVYVNDLAGGYLATKHLIDLGHTKIGFISDILDTQMKFVAMRERLNGYKKALREVGIPIDPNYQRQAPHGRTEARQMAQELLGLSDPPTAIFAASDTQAIGVLDVARERGIRVPSELSIIGYDGIRDAEYLNLTTISQPLFDSGYEGAQLLLALINEPSEKIHEIKLPIKLIQRSTTAAPVN